MKIHYILNCVYYFQYFVLLLRQLCHYYAGSSLILVRLQNCEKQLVPLSCLSAHQSICVEHLGSNWMDFHEIWCLRIFGNLLKKFKFNLNWMRITPNLNEDEYTFFIISHSGLLTMRNILDKQCRQNQNTHFTPITFFFKLCHLAT